MSIFKNLKDVDPTRGRKPFVTPGEYLTTVEKVRGGTNQKRNDYFAIDLVIDAVLAVYDHEADASGPEPTLEADRGGCCYIKLNTDWEELAMGNVKSFLQGAIGLSDAEAKQVNEGIDPRTGEAFEEADDPDFDQWVEWAEESIEGAGTMLAGTHLICHAENRPTKADQPFTVCTWEHLTDERWGALLAAVKAATSPAKGVEVPPAKGAEAPPVKDVEAPAQTKGRRGIGLPRRDTTPF